MGLYAIGECQTTVEIVAARISLFPDEGGRRRSLFIGVRWASSTLATQSWII